MSKLLFSIVTVCSNPGKSIYKTIESVRNQTYDNIEYIVIDNKSSDGTVEYLNELQSDMVRFYYYSEPDDGIYDAINKGISLATGDIIGVLHAGDQYTPDACQKVCNIYKNNMFTGVVYGGMRLVFKGSLYYRDLYTNIDMPNKLEKSMSLYHPSVFISKNTYDRYGLYNDSYFICADYELMLRLYKRQVKFTEADSILSIMEYGGISTQLRSANRMVNEILVFNRRDINKPKFYYKVAFVLKMLLHKLSISIHKIVFYVK